MFPLQLVEILTTHSLDFLLYTATVSSKFSLGTFCARTVYGVQLKLNLYRRRGEARSARALRRRCRGGFSRRHSVLRGETNAGERNGWVGHCAGYNRKFRVHHSRRSLITVQVAGAARYYCCSNVVVVVVTLIGFRCCKVFRAKRQPAKSPRNPCRRRRVVHGIVLN